MRSVFVSDRRLGRMFLRPLVLSGESRRDIGGGIGRILIVQHFRMVEWSVIWRQACTYPTGILSNIDASSGIKSTPILWIFRRSELLSD